jgi:hypothetical protein
MPQFGVEIEIRTLPTGRGAVLAVPDALPVLVLLGSLEALDLDPIPEGDTYIRI